MSSTFGSGISRRWIESGVPGCTAIALMLRLSRSPAGCYTISAFSDAPGNVRRLPDPRVTPRAAASSVASIEELWTLPASLHRLVLATQEASNVTGHITRCVPTDVVDGRAG